MAMESNASFHQDDTLGSAFQRHAISFQSGAVNSTSDMIPMGGYYGMNSSGANLIFGDNPNIISTSSPLSTSVGSAGSLLSDSVPGLKHDAGLAVEWGEDEQFKLEEGLVKFKDEPSIMKYIKIAATLRDKTVRDVALRCRWMTRKRRKQEESHLGRKGNYKKDKFAESSSKPNIHSTSIPTTSAFSSVLNKMDNSPGVRCEVLGSKAKQLLEQNFQAFTQINNNLSSLKLQENIGLFCRARDNINNIGSILENMKEFSGKIQLQELPVAIDYNLANNILPLNNDLWHTCGVQPKMESGP